MVRIQILGEFENLSFSVSICQQTNVTKPGDLNFEFQWVPKIKKDINEFSSNETLFCLGL